MAWKALPGIFRLAGSRGHQVTVATHTPIILNPSGFCRTVADTGPCGSRPLRGPLPKAKVAAHRFGTTATGRDKRGARDRWI